MHPFFDVERPVILGHRGAAGIRPENTLVSFETALAVGAQIVESDIHLTRDGVPVLIHDPTLDRTTNGSGDVAAHDHATLQDLDAAHDFEWSDSTEAVPCTVPTLEEAFRRFPEARFNLEIKSGDPRAIAATLELIARFERADRTLLAAGEDPIMANLRAALARLPGTVERPAVGACLGEIVAAVGAAVDGGPMPPGVMALQVPPSFMGNPLVTEPFVRHAHAQDVAVHVWTVNERSEIEALLELGVDGIVTDHPERMARWLGRHD